MLADLREYVFGLSRWKFTVRVMDDISPGCLLTPAKISTRITTGTLRNVTCDYREAGPSMTIAATAIRSGMHGTAWQSSPRGPGRIASDALRRSLEPRGISAKLLGAAPASLHTSPTQALDARRWGPPSHETGGLHSDVPFCPVCHPAASNWILRYQVYAVIYVRSVWTVRSIGLFLDTFGR